MIKNISHFPAKFSHTFHILFLSALAVSLGGTIYIFLRPSEHVFFGWISAVGSDRWLSLARHNPILAGPLFPEWFVFSLPNGLWAFAYSLLITSIWSGSKSWLKYFWMTSIPVLVLGFEILQYAGVIPGTFCMQDMAMAGAGISMGFIIGSKKIKNNSDEKALE